MTKLIVTVAPTSNFHGKEANPALPFSPPEVAEAVYECWNEGAGIVHIHGRDGRSLGCLPGVLPPLLEEVRIPLRLVDDHRQGIGLDRNAFVSCGLLDRDGRRVVRKRSDLGEVEQALGI